MEEVAPCDQVYVASPCVITSLISFSSFSLRHLSHQGLTERTQETQTQGTDGTEEGQEKTVSSDELNELLKQLPFTPDSWLPPALDDPNNQDSTSIF